MSIILAKPFRVRSNLPANRQPILEYITLSGFGEADPESSDDMDEPANENLALPTGAGQLHDPLPQAAPYPIMELHLSDADALQDIRTDLVGEGNRL